MGLSTRASSSARGADRIMKTIPRVLGTAAVVGSCVVLACCNEKRSVGGDSPNPGPSPTSAAALTCPAPACSTLASAREGSPAATVPYCAKAKPLVKKAGGALNSIVLIDDDLQYRKDWNWLVEGKPQWGRGASGEPLSDKLPTLCSTIQVYGADPSVKGSTDAELVCKWKNKDTGLAIKSGGNRGVTPATAALVRLFGAFKKKKIDLAVFAFDGIADQAAVGSGAVTALVENGLKPFLTGDEETPPKAVLVVAAPRSYLYVYVIASMEEVETARIVTAGLAAAMRARKGAGAEVPLVIEISPGNTAFADRVLQAKARVAFDGQIPCPKEEGDTKTCSGAFPGSVAWRGGPGSESESPARFLSGGRPGPSASDVAVTLDVAHWLENPSERRFGVSIRWAPPANPPEGTIHALSLAAPKLQTTLTEAVGAGVKPGRVAVTGGRWPEGASLPTLEPFPDGPCGSPLVPCNAADGLFRVLWVPRATEAVLWMATVESASLVPPPSDGAGVPTSLTKDLTEAAAKGKNRSSVVSLVSPVVEPHACVGALAAAAQGYIGAMGKFSPGELRGCEGSDFGPLVQALKETPAAKFAGNSASAEDRRLGAAPLLMLLANAHAWVPSAASSCILASVEVLPGTHQ